MVKILAYFQSGTIFRFAYYYFFLLQAIEMRDLYKSTKGGICFPSMTLKKPTITFSTSKSTTFPC